MPFPYLVGTGSSFVSYPPPTEVSGVFDSSGSRIESLCQTTRFLMEIEICNISLNEQKYFLYLKYFIYIFH